jgi:hypothetical protein
MKPAARSIRRLQAPNSRHALRVPPPLPAVVPASRNIRASTRTAQSLALSVVRRHASTATVQVYDTPDTPFPEPAAQDVALVPGSVPLARVLEDIHTLLAEEVGGADDWSRRIEVAIVDLKRLRRGRIAGEISDKLARPVTKSQ